MAHKRNEHGVFESMGRAVDESVAMAEALREGRLTRRQFDAWYSRRRAQSRGLIVDLRRRTNRILEPVSSAIEQGRHALGSVTPRPPRPRRRPVRRVALRRVSRRRVTAKRPARR
ncbi:MAG TPA: hypothetical protein VN915_03590 [Elusimicrobiota bacterium]|nr:hypothetical protein [Elusimicrobiota bacterium]